MTEHFVIAGAQRCGTTRLCRLLLQHPNICMAQPIRPEPKFFLHPDAVQMGYDAYLQRFFAHRDGQPVLGEKSTSYIERTDAIARLHAVLPHARLIFVLRDPVTRAYSNWRFSRKHGLETLDFEQALDAEPERLRDHTQPENLSVNPFAYAARGHYVRYLERWAQVFPREQFTILVSERLFSGHGEVREVFRALSVNRDVPLDELGLVNASTDDAPAVPLAAAARLREHFRTSVERLAREWNADTSAWQ